MKIQFTLICLVISCATLMPRGFAQTTDARQEVDLSGKGWKLWQDKEAQWKSDELFLPPVDLSKLKENPPTGGWQALETASGKDVAVPGTAEEYLQTTAGPEGDITGVTWWYRDVQIPAGANPKRVLLRFEGARERAEVYVNQKLVGYDMIGMTPFEADLSDVVKPGETAKLAVRITDPGGNFDWHDKGSIDWGRNRLLLSHGFGGITGRVKLIVCDPVYIDDLYVQNTPAITEINAELNVRNTSNAEVRRNVTVLVREKNRLGTIVATQQVNDVKLAPGANVVKVKVSAPNASLWDTEHPNLYICDATLNADGKATDSTRQTFGFRWFEPMGVGTDAMFRLNGKRIVLRSAISWGFWPINGIYATAEMAEKQIRTAKEMGLNMLNFHRCVGQPIILEKADELGLLYYEEPGNIASGMVANNPLARGMSREKYLRMVKRDRSHPCMIIYCMTNETDANGQVLEMYTSDMKAAHAIDPSRTFTRSSGLRCTPGINVEMSTKMHMFPFDDKVYMSGWYDDHHAGGPAVWTQTFYRNPKDYYHREIEDTAEIKFWGEEGAISTPPRLGLIKEQLDKSPNPGWDGGMYLAWYKMFDDFINDKKLRDAFPTVDSLCAAMGNISMEHQGRKIQCIRINNETDAYCINGWESEILENHSGVVDCFRNPKGSPAIMAYYNQPLYVAVMVRSQVAQLPGKVVADFYLVNEKDVKGPHKLQISAEEISGRRVFQNEVDVAVKGGDVYGQLLAEGVEIPLTGSVGRFVIDARLMDVNGKQVTAGHDEVLGVDWKSAELKGKGAVLDGGGVVGKFLAKRKGTTVPDYADGLDKLDWVIAARTPSAVSAVPVPAAQLRGLKVTFFNDQNMSNKALERADEMIDLSSPDGAPPDQAVNALNNYGVRWEGQLVPPATGDYTFSIQATGSATVTVDDKQISTGGARGGRRGGAAPSPVVHLEADKAVPIKLEWRQGTGDAHCRLLWIAPATTAPDPQKLLDRVKQDGTTLIILENAADWMELIQKNAPGIKYSGSFTVGRTWAGGVHFVRQHPLFKDLPANGGMDWPYQAVVRDGDNRTGLLIEGDQLVAGAFHSNTPLGNAPSPIRLGTAVGVIPCGKGKIIVSTLDITGNLGGADGPADVARKLLCNFVEYATTK